MSILLINDIFSKTIVNNIIANSSQELRIDEAIWEIPKSIIKSYDNNNTIFTKVAVESAVLYYLKIVE